MAIINLVLNIVGGSPLKLVFVKLDCSFAGSILDLICCIVFAD